MAHTDNHREEMISRLMRCNPFAGLAYYQSLTTRQLEETIERLEKPRKGARMTVTVYRHNRIDQAEERDPDDLACEFLAAIRGERGEDYKRMGRPHLELEYRWFLTGPPLSLSWHEEAWPAIWTALDHLLAGDERAEQDMRDWLTEVVR